MSEEAADEAGARARAEAAAWLARMRGPDAPSLTAEFEAWRSADPANDIAYARMLRRWDQSAFLTNSALGRARDLSRARRRPVAPALRYLAGAVVFAILGLGGAFVLDRTRPVVGPVIATTSVASSHGQLRTVRLDDGTKVTLDADSAIDLAYTRAERRLMLGHGRVRVDAAADPARPLIVDVPGGSIFTRQALFDLRPGQNGVEIALLRGGLDVAPARADGARRAVPLGHYVLLLPNGSVAQPIASTDGQLEWTKGMVSFDAERLADAVAAINRHNARQIELGSRDLAGLRITGAFHVADPDGFADAVAAMFGLTASRPNDRTIVLRKKS